MTHCIQSQLQFYEGLFHIWGIVLHDYTSTLQSPNPVKVHFHIIHKYFQHEHLNGSSRIQHHIQSN
jgi:hypothetical protein